MIAQIPYGEYPNCVQMIDATCVVTKQTVCHIFSLHNSTLPIFGYDVPVKRTVKSVHSSAI